jgi:hypothetical protein
VKITFASVGNTIEDKVLVTVNGFDAVAIAKFEPAEGAVENGPVTGHA